MELTFSRDCWYTTDIVGPSVTYTVRSPGMLQRHTTISRDDGQPVAEIDWHTFSASKLRVDGVESKLSDFIKRDRGFRNSDKRVFEFNGNRYRWSVSGCYNDMELECDGKSVATLQRKKVKTPVLRVDAHAEKMLDTVILTMIVMWKLDEEEKIAVLT